jgi:hypothetical protein
VAAAACSPLGTGLYVSFSRGALFGCAAGLVTLIVAARTRQQLRALLLCVAVAVLSSVAIGPLHGVTGLSGGRSTREAQGAIALGALLVISIAAAAIERRLIARERERAEPLPLPRRAGTIAAVLVCAGLALAIVLGAKENSVAPLSRGAGRLVTLQSNRYAYWVVALRAFAAQPLHGVGAGGWAVWWLRYRDVNEFAQDVHSLPLETLAEFGLVGGAFLLTFFGGVGLAARDALRVDPTRAAGPIAGCVAYVAHTPLDWDWQMPAVTLVAVVLAGALAAQSDSAILGASRLKSQTAATQIAT